MKSENRIEIPKGYHTVGNDVVCFPSCLPQAGPEEDIQTAINELENAREFFIKQSMVEEGQKGPELHFTK